MSVLNSKIEPGDTVRLASGGEMMTVIALDGDSVSLVWHGQHGELFRETLPLLALRHVGAVEKGARAVSGVAGLGD
jgi:hypothetical protein